MQEYSRSIYRQQHTYMHVTLCHDLVEFIDFLHVYMYYVFERMWQPFSTRNCSASLRFANTRMSRDHDMHTYMHTYIHTYIHTYRQCIHTYLPCMYIYYTCTHIQRSLTHLRTWGPLLRSIHTHVHVYVFCS